MLPRSVSPLGWTMVWQGPLASGLVDLLVRRLGFELDDLGGAPILAVHDGYVYLNANPFRVLGRRLPALGADNIDQVLQVGDVPMPDLEERPWHKADAVASAQLGQWSTWVRSSRNQQALVIDERRSEQVRRSRPDFAGLDDSGLVHRARQLQPLCRELFNQHLNQTLAALVGPPTIHEVCVAVGQPAHTLRLMSGLGNIDSVAPTHALWDLSRLVRESPVLSRIFDSGAAGARRVLELSNYRGSHAMLAGLDAFTAEVGFRGPNEWDLSSPTWDVAPEIVVALVDCLRRCDDDASPRHRRRHLEADRRRLAEEIAKLVDDRDRRRFDQALAATTTFLRGRERSRTSLIRVIHEMRLPLRELGRRAAQRGDLRSPDRIWLLTADEVAYYADGGLADAGDRTDDRAAQLDAALAPEPVPMYVEDNAGRRPIDSRDAGRADAGRGGTVSSLRVGEVMIGVPGSPGLAEARARVIDSDTDLALVQPGEILVLANPDLVAAPLFVTAAAVVLDKGRTFTHAAVVARELGIPVVVGATGASDRIRTGDLVNVDGLTGVVSVLAG